MGIDKISAVGRRPWIGGSKLYHYNARIYNVVDGDTVDCEIDTGFNGFRKERLRLIDIDTPERGHPGFKEALEYLEREYLEIPILINTVKKDSFGRWLAQLWTADGIVDINQTMIFLGFAKVYDR